MSVSFIEQKGREGEEVKFFLKKRQLILQISPGMASLREGMCQHSGRGAGFPEVGHSVDSILLVNNSN